MKRIGKVIIAVMLAGAACLIGSSFIMGNGSTWMAKRCLKRLQPVASFQDAQALDGVVSREFADGTWLCGIGVNSHGNPWGGTLVTKDSNGRTRVFFGHVCGSAGVLGPALAYSSNSLAQAYSNLLEMSPVMEQHYGLTKQMNSRDEK